MSESVVLGSTAIGDASLKRVLESVGVGAGLPKQEVIDQLVAAGIDSYVTADGHLMVRYWQMAVPNFVAPETAAALKSTQIVPREAASLEWVAANLGELQAKYAGRWIAVVNGAVASDAGSLPELMATVKARKIVEPFVTKIPIGESNWKTLFGID